MSLTTAVHSLQPINFLDLQLHMKDTSQLFFQKIRRAIMHLYQNFDHSVYKSMADKLLKSSQCTFLNKWNDCIQKVILPKWVQQTSMSALY